MKTRNGQMCSRHKIDESEKLDAHSLFSTVESGPSDPEIWLLSYPKRRGFGVAK